MVDYGKVSNKEMMKMKKLEYNDLEKLGLSEKALYVYSNSDWVMFEKEEKVIVTVNNDLVSDNNSIKDIEDFLLMFY